MRTFSIKAEEVQKEWFEIDAAGKTLGRLSCEIARVLTGKHKPTFSPHIDMGDHVVVVNAEQVVLTGKKLTDKFYWRHSGYQGSLRLTSAKDMLKRHPERVIEHAVKGMLPNNKLRAVRMGKLKVYAGAAHPHQAQSPKRLEVPTAVLGAQA
ncbi:MAG: 50S ribosomal protein L13 [Proteobacteria bacterium]|nr:50S ribosomal protein L13 [Pseudomonadota bacterium]